VLIFAKFPRRKGLEKARLIDLRNRLSLIMVTLLKNNDGYF